MSAQKAEKKGNFEHEKRVDKIERLTSLKPLLLIDCGGDDSAMHRLKCQHNSGSVGLQVGTLKPSSSTNNRFTITIIPVLQFPSYIGRVAVGWRARNDVLTP